MILPKPDERNEPITIDLTGPEGNASFLLARAKGYADQIWGNDITPEIETSRGISDGIDALYELADGMVEEFGENANDGPNNMGEYITGKMREGDYENLLLVFDKYFGSIVTLYR